MKLLLILLLTICSARAERVLFQHYGDIGIGKAGRGITLFFIPQAGYEAPSDGGYTVVHLKSAGVPFELNLPPGLYNYTFIPTNIDGTNDPNGSEAPGTFSVVHDATLVCSLTIVSADDGPGSSVGIAFAQYAQSDATSRALLFLVLMAGFGFGWMLLSPLEVM